MNITELNNNGENLAFYASSLDDLKKLKEKGVSLKILNNKNQSILTKYVSKNELKIVEYLVKEIPTFINYEDDDTKTPIFYAKTAEMVQLLMDNGADINHVDEKLRTVLHRKFEPTELNFINFLVKKCGLNINEKDQEGSSPLYYQEHIEVLEKMKELGANLNQVNHFYGLGTNFQLAHRKELVQWFNKETGREEEDDYEKAEQMVKGKL